MTDYEKWKEWLDQWAIEYKEIDYFDGVKCFEISGWYAAMYVIFDLNTEKYLEAMVIND